MFYFQKEPEYFKIVEVANKLNIDQIKIYDYIQELERYNVVKFKKTPLGSNLIEKEQIKLVEEYANLRGFLTKPREATLVLKHMNIIPEPKEDFEWAKGLKKSIWRRF